MREGIPLFRVLLLVAFCCGLGYLPALHAQTALLVDTRLMVMAHPLTNSFDQATRRFRNTSSEPLGSGETPKNIELGIRSLELQLKTLQEQFARGLKNAAVAQRNSLEQTYLEQRRSLELMLAEQKERRFRVEEVPLNPGLTSYDAIQPQIQTISADLQSVVRALREKYQAATVIDVASLLPLFPPQGNPEILRQNCHFYFWRNSFGTVGNVSQEWMLQAKRYWAHRDSQLSPVPYGARDVRFEAAQMMAMVRRK